MALRIYFTIDPLAATAERDAGYGSNKRILHFKKSDKRPDVEIDETCEATYYITFANPLTARLPRWMEWVNIEQVTLHEQVFPGPRNQVSLTPGVYGTPHGVHAEVTTERDHWLVCAVCVGLPRRNFEEPRHQPEAELLAFFRELLAGEKKPIKEYLGNGKRN